MLLHRPSSKCWKPENTAETQGSWAFLGTIGPRATAERFVELDFGGEGVREGETFSFLHEVTPQPPPATIPQDPLRPTLTRGPIAGLVTEVLPCFRRLGRDLDLGDAEHPQIGDL